MDIPTTNVQITKVSLYLVFRYRTEAFLYKSFSRFTHLSNQGEVAFPSICQTQREEIDLPAME
jgi:hypothetical protein